MRVQDDLFHAANGGWLKATEIPADKPEYGTFIQLRDLSDKRVRAIVDELATPVAPTLAEIDAIQTPVQLAAWQGRRQGRLNTPNEIVFLTAILEPPFFDMAADDAGNYGAIGAIIGHEISHGFDDAGSQFDGDGLLAPRRATRCSSQGQTASASGSAGRCGGPCSAYSTSDAKSARRERSPRASITWPECGQPLKRSTA